jgi:DNA gyrase subunit A
MGRATSGVTGMKFREGDALLSMSIIGADMAEDDRFVFTVTDGGFAKRTPVSEYRQQGRGGFGIKAMKLNEDRGSLVGGLVVAENDQVIAIKASGQITRSAVSEVAVKGRDTMGVKFVGVRDDDSVVVIALNPEATAAAVELNGDVSADDVTAVDAAVVSVLEDTEAGGASDDDAPVDDSAVDDSVPDSTEAEEDDSE